MTYPDIPPSENHGIPHNAVGPRLRECMCWHDWGFRWIDEKSAYECKACGLLIRPETWLKWNPDIQFPKEMIDDK